MINRSTYANRIPCYLFLSVFSDLQVQSQKRRRRMYSELIFLGFTVDKNQVHIYHLCPVLWRSCTALFEITTDTLDDTSWS